MVYKSIESFLNLKLLIIQKKNIEKVMVYALSTLLLTLLLIQCSYIFFVTSKLLRFFFVKHSHKFSCGGCFVFRIKFSISFDI